MVTRSEPPLVTRKTIARQGHGRGRAVGRRHLGVDLPGVGVDADDRPALGEVELAAGRIEIGIVPAAVRAGNVADHLVGRRRAGLGECGAAAGWAKAEADAAHRMRCRNPILPDESLPCRRIAREGARDEFGGVADILRHFNAALNDGADADPAKPT